MDPETNQKRSRLAEIFLAPVSKILLFQSAVSFYLIYFLDKEFRQGVFELIPKNQYEMDSGGGILLFILLIFIGAAYSIYHALSTRKKSALEKRIMLAYLSLINLIMAVVALFYIPRDNYLSYALYVFPVWVVYYSLARLIMFGWEITKTDSVSDELTNPRRLLFGFFTVGILVFLGVFILQTHWSVTYSIAIGWATVVDDYLVKKIRFT